MADGGEMISLQSLRSDRPGECAGIVARAIDTFGSVDVLYNNAAAAHFNRKSQLATVMRGRLGRPLDATKAALFLASEDADSICASTAGMVACSGGPSVAVSQS
jgi:NAD(P)-dependent dehydrogenase (short-subunit alcohol dehydrogenase family)